MFYFLFKPISMHNKLYNFSFGNFIKFNGGTRLWKEIQNIYSLKFLKANMNCKYVFSSLLIILARPSMRNWRITPWRYFLMKLRGAVSSTSMGGLISLLPIINYFPWEYDSYNRNSTWGTSRFYFPLGGRRIHGGGLWSSPRLLAAFSILLFIATKRRFGNF